MIVLPRVFGAGPEAASSRMVLNRRGSSELTPAASLAQSSDIGPSV
jgi:hypothetical protein